MIVFLWRFIEIFGVAPLCCRPLCKTMIVTVVVTRRRLIQLELMDVCFHIKLIYSVLVPFQPSPWSEENWSIFLKALSSFTVKLEKDLSQCFHLYSCITKVWFTQIMCTDFRFLKLGWCQVYFLCSLYITITMFVVRVNNLKIKYRLVSI